MSLANAPRRDGDFRLAVRGCSLEIGTGDACALQQFGDRITAGTAVFLNQPAKERLGERVSASRCIHDLGLVPVPHVAARRLAGPGELRHTVRRFRDEGGVRDFLVVAGDLPEPAGTFTDSLEVLRSLDGVGAGIRSVGVAGYPDGHPLIPMARRQELLGRKIELLRSMSIEPFVALQFSFDATSIVSWCERFHARFPDVVVRAGLPGPARLATLLKYAGRCGVRASLGYLKTQPAAKALRLLGRVPPTEQALAIGRYRRDHNDNLAVHLFTFGGVDAALAFIDHESASCSGQESAR